jgi:hypothetical protein
VIARLLLPVGCCAVVLAACGAGAGGADRARTQTATPKAAPPAVAPPGGPPTARPRRDPRELPPGVPLTASRAVDPGRANVIRAWSAALRAGDIHPANALWATPAKVQNGTPVLELPDRASVAIFNGSLPCGSVVTAAGGAPGGFTVTTVRLTRRRGAVCDAVGATARTAILVRGGKIVAWYRLPDDPRAPGPERAAPSDGVESTTV